MIRFQYFLLELSLVLLLLVPFQIVASPSSDKNSFLENVVNNNYLLPKLQAEYLPQKDILSLERSIWIKQQDNQFSLQQGKNWLLIDMYNNSSEPKEFHILINGTLHINNSQFLIQRLADPIQELPIYYHIDNLRHSPVAIAPFEKLQLYIMLQSNSEVVVPVTLLATDDFSSYLAESYFASGIAIGFLSALALTMLLIFFTSGNQSILLLSGYFLTQALLLAVIFGIDFVNSIPQLKGCVSLIQALSAVLILSFSSKLFNLKYINSQISTTLKLTCGLLLLFLPFSLFISFEANLIIGNALSIFISLMLVSLGIYTIKIRQRLSILFTAIFSFQLVFIATNVIVYGWQQYNAGIYTAALWLNALLITYLLSKQYNDQIKEKHLAEKEAFENAMISRNAQEELIALQNENQEQLEHRVQERTLELNIALQELEEANKELEQKNTIDELTGLYNRRYYDQKIMAEHRRSRRNLTPLSLIIIDIDHFKAVNDSYGHLAGDKCLVELSSRIKRCLRRSSDIGCRYGGEEFCIILPETDTQGAMALAEEIRQLFLATTFETGVEPLPLTISCGVSTYLQQRSVAPEHIFSAADKALYQAKHQGRNLVIEGKIEFDLDKETVI